jgi:hypothetical protein
VRFDEGSQNRGDRRERGSTRRGRVDAELDLGPQVAGALACGSERDLIDIAELDAE